MENIINEYPLKDFREEIAYLYCVDETSSA